MKVFLLLLLLQSADAQINPSSRFFLNDTASRLQINDFFIGSNGTVYSTGQFVKNSLGLYISAVTSAGVPLFELFRKYTFEDKGLFIRPYDATHFIVCGYSEDTTGTFNIRLLMVTTSGTVVWDTTFGNDGNFTMEIPHDVEIDSKGNIVIAGTSFSAEVNFLLIKFSSEGKRLWAIQSKPFSVGQFNLHDIVLDANDNIYGVTNNTFVEDTSSGTVLKWDPSGALLWQKNFNLSFYEKQGSNLLLIGDTLMVVGGTWKTGENPVAFRIVSFRTNGEMLSYKTIPVFGVQQGVSAIQKVMGNRIAVLNETHRAGMYRVHTLIFSSDFSLLFQDSVSSIVPLHGRIIESLNSTFAVIRYGDLLTKTVYSSSNGAITESPHIAFSLNGGNIAEIEYYNSSLFALNSIHGANSDRVEILIYNNPKLSVAHGSVQSIGSFDLLQVFPNPFNPSTTIRFSFAGPGETSVNIYDMLGRNIARLFNGFTESSDVRTIRYDASGFPSGTYVVRAQHLGQSITKSILLLK